MATPNAARYRGYSQQTRDDMLAQALYEMVFGDGNAITAQRIADLLDAGANIRPRGHAQRVGS